ncbi:MAG: hydantoinase/oxoprolinase family protein [Thermodesulfobacteriota bacterium]
MSVRIAVDVGGTFTDLYAVDDEQSREWIAKVPSSPEDSSKGILAGVRRLLAENAVPADSVAHLIQGTTVATNAVLQRTGARTALVTTRGFRDVLEIARQKRPHLYDLSRNKVEALVPRRMRLEVSERVLASGEVALPLAEEEVRLAARKLAEEKIEAVAVCFLHSYRYPVHERMATRILREELPGVYICCSSEVLPEFREYERMTTTVLNAYLGPIVSSYVGRIKERLHQSGIGGVVSIVQSNGGIMSSEVASRKPVFLVLSGPSSGVSGAARVSKAAGFADAIAFDMGGTSTDVSLIVKGRVSLTSEREIAGLPCRVPMVDVETVGAGGGSVAWVDVGGLLKVGPHSAGADPGPAAYDKGGVQPTVTDANLVLGRLGSGSLLGGEIHLNRGLSARAIEEGVAKRFGISLEEASLGIIRVANANMVRAVRSVSVQRGFDPRHFALVAFGGAGPMHAVGVAKELGIRTVLVPPSPGVLCAMGTLTMDVRTDAVRTVIVPAREDSIPVLRSILREMIEEARQWLTAQGLKPEDSRIQTILDMRYRGQNYELEVLDCHPTDREGLRAAVDEFHHVHQRVYGYCNPERPVEVVNARLAVLCPNDRESSKMGGPGRVESIGRERTTRDVFFDESKGYVETPIWWRGSLESGETVSGPTIIESLDSTVVIPPGAKGTLDSLGNLIISC